MNALLSRSTTNLVSSTNGSCDCWYFIQILNVQTGIVCIFMIFRCFLWALIF
jgi:hypothetical protein